MVDKQLLTKKCCPVMLLLRLLIQVALTTASGLSKSTHISFEPAILHDLVEGRNKTVVVTLKVAENVLNLEPQQARWNISLVSLHEEIADVAFGERQVTKEDFEFDNSSRFYTLDTSFTVRGLFLGKTGVRAKVVSADWTEEANEWQVPYEENLPVRADPHILDVWVKRHEDSVWLTKVFVSTLIILITIANVIMGCELDMNVVLETVKRPVAPTIGFLTQFLIMPLLAYVISQFVFVSRGLHSFALGLFITGCAPGGGASNFWTILLGGNVNLSVTMTFLSTLASLFMMPFWISLLGVHFLQGFSATPQLRVPYTKIISSLVSLVLPVLIGVSIAKYKPNVAVKARKIMRPFITFVLIFVICFGCVANSYMWRIMTLPSLVGGLLLPWCGFMLGCFTSILLRRKPADVTAIAIETGIQNTGIAILMLKWSFPEPDSDLSALIPVIVACFTPGPLLAGAGIHMLLERWQKKSDPVTNVDVIGLADQSMPLKVAEMNIDPVQLSKGKMIPLPLEA